MCYNVCTRTEPLRPYLIRAFMSETSFYLKSIAAKHRRRQIRAILRTSVMSFKLSLIVDVPPFYTCV